MPHPTPVYTASDVDTFMRSASKAAMRTNLGLKSASTVRTLHVAAYGTGGATDNGSLELPYLTAQQAYNAAVLLAATSQPVVIKFGVGSFGNISTTTWNTNVILSGVGYVASEIGTITVTAGINVIRSDETLYIQQITASGANGTAGTTGSGDGGPGGDGGNGAELQLSGVIVGTAVANGGTGGVGGNGGGYNDGGYGSSGGNGGNGGTGGTISMSHCRIGVVLSGGGTAGTGGAGGPGAEGDGPAGSSGSNGLGGSVYCYHSAIGSLTAEYLATGNSSIETSSYGTYSDLGGSSNAPFYLP